jgi:hypothetical protein
MLLAFFRQIWQAAFGWSRGSIVNGACLDTQRGHGDHVADGR